MTETVISFHKKLPRLIEDVIAPMGRYQYAIVFMLCFNNAITAIATVITTFYSFQPDFVCGDLEQNQCNSNGTCSVDYVFKDGDHTIVSEWSLVCDRKLIAPAVSTLYFVGLTIGAFVCGIFSDRFGRKPTLLFCLYAQGVIGLSLSIIQNLYWFIILRIIQGFFVQGMQTVTYTLLMEYCSPTKRTMAGMVFELMWAKGLIFLGGMAYVVRDWRQLQIFLAIPTIITVFWVWLIPESMHWLYTNRREKQAFEVCVKTARYNKNYDDIADDHRYWKKHIKDEKQRSVKDSIEVNRTSFWTILNDLFKTSCLRKHILIMACTWFNVAMSYYGLLFFMPTLTGNRHLNFILSGVIEFFVYLATYVVLAKFGRRKPLMLYLCMNGVLLVIISICKSYHVTELVQIFITLLARGTTSSIFYATFVQANELFPTTNRGCAFGICGLMGRIGGILAPFLVPLASLVSPILPMTIMGSLSILTGIAQYWLPETLNIQMPNSVEDAKRIWDPQETLRINKNLHV